MAGLDLFLLAHPDDDLFVRPLLMERSENRKAVVFLTNGEVPGRATGETRRREAKRALRNTSVETIIWVGMDAGIVDGTLAHRIEAAHAALLESTKSMGSVSRVITHAWEGGHPDHDAAHLIGLAVAKGNRVLSESLVAPYYRAPRSGPVPFLVMSPLQESGPVERRPMTLMEGLRLLGSIRHYPSQLVPLAGLAPGMILATLFRRQFSLQAMDQSPAPKRPMTGKLLYERRSGLSFMQFKEMTDGFVARHELGNREAFSR